MSITNAPSGTIRSALRYPDFRWLLSFQLPIVLAPVIAAAATAAAAPYIPCVAAVTPRVAIGAGGRLGTALAGRVSRLPSRSVLAAALALAGLPTLLLAVVRWPAVAIVLTGLTGTGALLVEILTETTLQRELDEDYALLVIRGAAGAAAGPASQPAMADAVPAR
jgi:hypothetical protein